MEKERVRVLLWLDDQRNPYNGSWLYDFAPEYETKGAVHWVKNYNEFAEWITENGLPDMIGFDHDLGLEESGYDAAKWLVDYCLDYELKMCQWVIQSANPVGKDNINGLLMGYIKHAEK